MGWWGDLLENNTERQAIVQLNYEIQRLSERYTADTANLKFRSNEWQEVFSRFVHEVDTIGASIAQIETEQMIRRAERWRVPIPMRPYGSEESTEIWIWHAPHARHYLSNVALSKYRREVYQEWEMWSKPWLSWGAIIISVISLIVAVTKS